MILEKIGLLHIAPHQLAFSGHEHKEKDLWKDFKLLLLVVVKWEEGEGSKNPFSSGWKDTCSIDSHWNGLIETFSMHMDPQEVVQSRLPLRGYGDGPRDALVTHCHHLDSF